MHFCLDVMETLTDEAAFGQWGPLIRVFKENGHSVSVLSSGSYGPIQERFSGVDKTEFDHVFENRNKSFLLEYKTIAKSLGEKDEHLCLIDNDFINIFSAYKAGWRNSILYQGMDNLKKELSDKGYILA